MRVKGQNKRLMKREKPVLEEHGELEAPLSNSNETRLRGGLGVRHRTMEIPLIKSSIAINGMPCGH